MRSSIGRRKTGRMRNEDGLKKLPMLRGPGKEENPEKKTEEMVKVAGKLEKKWHPQSKKKKVLKQAQLLTLLSKVRTERKNVHVRFSNTDV